MVVLLVPKLSPLLSEPALRPTLAPPPAGEPTGTTGAVMSRRSAMGVLESPSAITLSSPCTLFTPAPVPRTKLSWRVKRD